MSQIEQYIGKFLLDLDTSETLLPEEKCIYCGHELITRYSKITKCCGSCSRRGYRLPHRKCSHAPHNIEDSDCFYWGYINTKHGKHRRKFCKICGSFFTEYKNYSFRMKNSNDIIEKAKELNKNLSLRETAKEIMRIYNIKISHQTIRNWTKHK